MGVKNEGDKKTVLLVNITWNPDGWGSLYCDPNAGHEYAREHPGHESLNFNFNKRIDTNGFIHGYFHPVVRGGRGPKNFCDNGIIIFYTTNRENGRGEIVGIYGKAQIIDTKSYTCKGFENDTGAANIRAEKRYSMLFPIPLSAAEYAPKKYKYVGAKQLIGHSCFGYMLDAFAKDIILDEINELKKYGTKYEEELIKLIGIYECYFGKLKQNKQYINNGGVHPYLEDDEKKYMEGGINKSKKEVTEIHRSSKARKTCLDFYFKKNDHYTCQICGFDFEETYGEIGKRVIEVHHIESLARVAKNVGEHEIEPTKDLIPVCSNCHNIIHKRKPPLKIGEIKRHINVVSRQK